MEYGSVLSAKGAVLYYKSAVDCGKLPQYLSEDNLGRWVVACNPGKRKAGLITRLVHSSKAESMQAYERSMLYEIIWQK